MNWYKKARFITEDELREKARSLDYSLLKCVGCGRWIDMMKKAISDWKFEDEMSEGELKVVNEVKESIANGRGSGLSTCRHCISKALKADIDGFKEVMTEHEHYEITCSECGDVNKCRCLSVIHDKNPVHKTVVDSCPSCEDKKESAVNSTMSVSPSIPMSEDVSVSVGPRQIYMRDDVIQNREDLAPSMLRKRKKRRRKLK